MREQTGGKVSEMVKVESLEACYKSLVGKKTFGIENINFHMEPGYIYGLVGRNGAGKTTLIKSILKGRYAKGEVWIDGFELGSNSVKAKENMGFIMYPELMLHNRTAYENGCIFGNLYPGWDQERYVNKLKEFGVDMDEYLSRLSRGNIMKAMAAFVWGYRPKVLFADEPTAGFDPVFRKEFLKFMQEYVEDGMHSVLISTHITGDLDKVADYIMIMDEGKILLNQSIEDIRDSYRMIKCSREEFGRLKQKLFGDSIVGVRQKGENVEAMLKFADEGLLKCEVWKPQVSELLRYVIMK